MTGFRRVEQAALFHEVSLDTHILADPVSRAIDRFFGLSGLRA